MRLPDGVSVETRGILYEFPALQYGDIWLAWSYGPEDLRLGLYVELVASSLQYIAGRYPKPRTTVFVVCKLMLPQVPYLQAEAKAAGWHGHAVPHITFSSRRLAGR